MQHSPASTVKQCFACAATCFCFCCLVLTFVRTAHPTGPYFTSAEDRITRTIERQRVERTAMFAEAPVHVAAAPAMRRPE